MNTPEQPIQEDIKKGLARLNGAWQILKKEKEDYQRAQEGWHPRNSCSSTSIQRLQN